MKVVRQARLELSGGSTPDLLRPPCENNALVRTTVGVVSATFGTMSYFALYNAPPPPFQNNTRCCFRPSLGLQCCSCKGAAGY